MTNGVAPLQESEVVHELETVLSALLNDTLAPFFFQPQLLDKPSAWFGHIPFAYWIIKATKPRILVELGTHAGVSFATFCAAVKNERMETRCWAVDTWQGDVQAGLYPEAIYQDLLAFNDTHFKDFATLLRCTFDDALQHFADGSIDLLHIDGVHSYEAVSHDFTTWKPKLSPRAVVLLHDTNESKDGCGVWKFWEEAQRDHPAFSFLHAHGLGVLAVGPEAPQAIRALCAIKDQSTIVTLRSRFQTIGTSWEAQARTMRLQKETSALRTEHKDVVKNLQREVSNLVDKHLQLSQHQRLVEQESLQEQQVEDAAKIEALEARVKELDGLSKRLARERREILESTSWLITRPVRALARLSPRSLKSLVRTCVKTPYRTVASLKQSPLIKTAFKLPPLNWLKYRIRQIAAVETDQFDTARSQEWLRALLKHPARQTIACQKPLVSVVLPTRNRGHLVPVAIASVLAQRYPNWELLVVDDGSTDDTTKILQERFTDPRIKILQSHGQGVCEARNCGLRAAQGAFIAYLDSDNTWSPEYLEYMLYDMERNGSDCGYAVLHCVNTSPHFYRQVAFDYTRLKTRNFIDLNVFMHRRKLLDERGLFDVSLRRMVDWDLILRYTKGTKTSLAYFVGAHYDAGDAADRITQSESVSYLDVVRNKHWIDWPGLCAQLATRDPEVVSVIMCVYGQGELTDQCITSLFQQQAGEKFELILVDNASDPTTRVVLERWASQHQEITLIRNPENFNFALGNNIGFAASRGARVVFLNSDTVVTPEWLRLLVRPLHNPGIKGSQPKLLFPDGRIQCVGLVFSDKSLMAHPIYNNQADGFSPTQRSRDYYAVTAACLAMRAEDFAATEGFDPLCTNGQEDVDLCLRVRGGNPLFRSSSPRPEIKIRSKQEME